MPALRAWGDAADQNAALATWGCWCSPCSPFLPQARGEAADMRSVRWAVWNPVPGAAQVELPLRGGPRRGPCQALAYRTPPGCRQVRAAARAGPGWPERGSAESCFGARLPRARTVISQLQGKGVVSRRWEGACAELAV